MSPESRRGVAFMRLVNWSWLIFQVTLFLLPGLFTTDVSSYVMYGHITGIYNLNPYIYPPAYFPGNELLDPGWIHPIWWNTPTVYGPLWTWIGLFMAKLITPLELQDRLFAYKLLMNGVQLVNLGLVWWLLGRTLPNQRRARLTAFTLFAWNPLVLFDVAGNAHNDALMVTLLLLGLVPLVAARRTAQAHDRPANWQWLLGILFVGLSALIKYTTVIVGLLDVVPWARQLPSWRARFAWIGGAGVLVGGLSYALLLPWIAPEVISNISNAASLQMYSNSMPDVGALLVSNYLIDPGGPTGLPFYQGLSETIHTGDGDPDVLLRLGGSPPVAGWQRLTPRGGDRARGRLGARLPGPQPAGLDVGARVVLPVAAGAGVPARLAATADPRHGGPDADRLADLLRAPLLELEHAGQSGVRVRHPAAAAARHRLGLPALAPDSGGPNPEPLPIPCCSE